MPFGTKTAVQQNLLDDRRERRRRMDRARRQARKDMRRKGII